VLPLGWRSLSNWSWEAPARSALPGLESLDPVAFLDQLAGVLP